MQRNYIGAYINAIKNKVSLIEIRKAVFRYELLAEQFGQQFRDAAIKEVKQEKDKENLNDLEVFLAYENEIEKKVWKMYSDYVVTPIKEIESNDVAGLVKRYNTTPEIAQTIIDLKIIDPYNPATLADIILKFKLRNNPNALELSRIILCNGLKNDSNAVMLAEIIKNFNLKDNPDAIKISRFIMNNNLKDNPDAIKIYYIANSDNLKNNPNAIELSRIIYDNKLSNNPNGFMLAETIRKFALKDDPDATKIAGFIIENNLENNRDAVVIANMVCKYGISLDLAIEVSDYNNGNYILASENFEEKYVFHKLRQIYQAKLKTEQNLNIQQEIERIMATIGIDQDKARYFLICCMGNNWGRNSSFYWDYDRFKEDANNDSQEYTDEELRYIRGYLNQPGINRFARGFKIHDGQTFYNDGNTAASAMTNEDIIFKAENFYLPTYKALNKYSLPKDIIVFRGTSIRALAKYQVSLDDSEEEIKRKLAGHYEDGGFFSTSVVVENGGSGAFLNNKLNFLIDLKAGTPCGDLRKYSEYDNEYEILLPPNVTFNVNDVKKIDGKIFVYLTSIPTKSITYASSIEEESDDMKSRGKHNAN